MQPAVIEPELKLNPDRLINLEINNKRRKSIKKKSGLSINPDILHSKVFSSEQVFKGSVVNRALQFLHEGPPKS